MLYYRGMKNFAQNPRRFARPPGFSLLWSCSLFALPLPPGAAQQANPPVTSPGSAPPGSATLPAKPPEPRPAPTSVTEAPPAAESATQQAEAALANSLHFTSEAGSSNAFTGELDEMNVTLQYAGVTISADRMQGNFRREVIFSGHARIVANGIASQADAIHFFPRTRTYRIDNPRALIAPSALGGRIRDPLFISGGELRGATSGYEFATNSDGTTCLQPIHKHYELRSRTAELIPGKRLTLRRVAVYFFGQKLIVIPEIVIPLNPEPANRRPRTDYFPEFGRNLQEGYFARFPYTFAIGAAAATFLRLDLTERLGPGYRVEQEYLAGKQSNAFNVNSTANYSGGLNFGGISSLATGGQGTYGTAYGYGSVGGAFTGLGTGIGPQSGGLFAAQGYLKDGFDRNFTASLKHQQSIGGDNQITFSTELQKNSSFSFSDQSAQNTRFNFAHSDPAHGSAIDTSVSYNTSDSTGFSTSQFTGHLRESTDFGVLNANRNSFTTTLDVNRNVSDSASSVSRTARLESQAQFQHVSRDYSFTLLSNGSTPIGNQTQGSNFGTLERLPEMQFALNTVGFQGGWLKRVPAELDIGAGQYSEPGSNTNDNRVLVGLNVQQFNLLRGKTELVTGGGFEQRLYGDGAAQYITRNTTQLRQHLGGRSGIDLNYQYQQPRGGTPFNFDTFTRSHYITAEGGYLDDKNFQVTARVGYDLLGASVGHSWQSVSTRLMYRPNSHTRFDALATYDPNTARFFSATASVRLRGRNDFAADLQTRYDPSTGRFSQVNGQFDVPLGGGWRVSSLLRYNGLRGQFESTNAQVVKRWDCMEASLTYTATPFGFQNTQEIYFAIRLTAFPFFRSFARGAAGDTPGTGLGDLY